MRNAHVLISLALLACGSGNDESSNGEVEFDCADDWRTMVESEELTCAAVGKRCSAGLVHDLYSYAAEYHERSDLLCAPAELCVLERAPVELLQPENNFHVEGWTPRTCSLLATTCTELAECWEPPECWEDGSCRDNPTTCERVDDGTPVEGEPCDFYDGLVAGTIKCSGDRFRVCSPIDWCTIRAGNRPDATCIEKAKTCAEEADCYDPP